MTYVKVMDFEAWLKNSGTDRAWFGYHLLEVIFKLVDHFFGGRHELIVIVFLSHLYYQTQRIS